MNPHTLHVLELSHLIEILLRYASTPLGRYAVLKLAPFKEDWKIQRALKQTTEMRGLVESKIRLPLSGLEDIRSAIKQVKEGHFTFTAEQFSELRQTLLTAIDLAQFLRNLGEESYPELFRLSHRIQVPENLLQQLKDTFDEHGKLVDHATPKLAELRKKMREYEEQIRSRIEQLQQKYAKFLQSISYTIRKDHFVLPVRAECRGQVRGLCLDQSQSGETLFIEPQETILLSSQFDEIRQKEQDEVTRIYWELTMAILAEEKSLKELSRFLGVVDLTYAKARMSVDFQMSEPLLNTEYLYFKEARHPLLMWEKSNKEIGRPVLPHPEKVTPIEVHLGQNFDLLMITGPNTGGKTMVLKTVGLLTLMAHCGMHISAKSGSSLPIFSQIHADIGDEQSIAQSLSTFSGHLKNIITLLQQADSHSLVLLDELGSGTDPDEGAALGTAILEQLMQQGAKIIATTHLSPLKNFAYLYPRAENGCVDFNPETLQPTYRLLIGIPGNSNALNIAEYLGLPTSIIHKARQLVDPKNQQEKRFFEQLQQSRVLTEDARLQMEELKEKTQHIKEEAEEELKVLTERKNRIEKEANHEIENRMRTVLEELAPILARLKNVPKHILPDVEELNRVLKEQLRATPLGERRREFIQKLRVEDLVYLPKFKKNARVKKMDQKKESVKVNMNGILMDIPFDDISWLESQ